MSEVVTFDGKVSDLKAKSLIEDESLPIKKSHETGQYMDVEEHV